MEWALAFYARQFELLADAETWEIQDKHRERASVVENVVAPPARVLELGAGGGQAAAALADPGYEVVANELVPQIAARAQKFAAVPRSGTMTVLLGNFYEINLDGPFDVLCYWDGFGLGSDADQRALLRRVRSWLNDEGRALIEIYTPWYWADASGRTMTFGRARRRYGFNARGNRMLDTWWSDGDAGSSVAQSLRCYAPADLELLLQGTESQLVGVKPGGRYHAEANRFEERVPLEQAMSYVATLAPIT